MNAQGRVVSVSIEATGGSASVMSGLVTCDKRSCAYCIKEVCQNESNREIGVNGRGDFTCDGYKYKGGC